MTGVTRSISSQASRRAGRLLRLGALPLLLLLPHAAAKACAGGPYTGPVWTLDHRQYADDIGLPFLSPGNDSRINLQFLMLDAASRRLSALQPTADFTPASTVTGLFDKSDLDTACGRAPRPADAPIADGEGSRCLSLESGKRAFLDAARAESALSESERAALIEARNALDLELRRKKREHPAAADPLAKIAKPSATARDFAAYLMGAKAFYDGAFDAALAQFASLAKSQNAWLRETARYMSARAWLNKAQVGAFADFDGTAEPKVSGQGFAHRSRERLQGLSRGLSHGALRRFGARADAPASIGSRATRRSSAPPMLRSCLMRAKRAPPRPFPISPTRSTSNSIGEKGESRDPKLLAVADLMRMRVSGDKKPDFPAKDLEAQAKDFRGREVLFDYLKAARAYYVDGDFAQTLKLLGEPSAGPLSPLYLAFSRETLRGQALMAQGQYEKAVEQWRRLLPLAADPWQKEAVELGLAMSWERAWNRQQGVPAGDAHRLAAHPRHSARQCRGSDPAAHGGGKSRQHAGRAAARALRAALQGGDARPICELPAGL